MSIDRVLPHIKSALQLAITKHEFLPGQLFKLDSQIKEKLKVKSFEILEDGGFTQQEWDALPKEYPSFHFLYDPLNVYFDILQFFIISSGNILAA